MMIVGNTLHMTNLNKDMEGMYQCSAQNTHGVAFTAAQLRILSKNYLQIGPVPGRIAQSAMCLTTDASQMTADPGVESSIPARSHTFMEIDHEIISRVILLPSADSFTVIIFGTLGSYLFLHIWENIS